VAGPHVRRRALVLGAGTAGLLAARVLAEAFADVLILDGDPLAGGGAARTGVPQGRHAHVLLGRGQQILEELFPGFTGDAVAAGSPVADFGALRTYVGSRRLQPARTGALCLSIPRPELDSRLLARVRALPSVRLLAGTAVLGLVPDSDAGRVRGVRVRSGSGRDEVIGADLVVDATGRNSRTPAWLAELGYRPPTEDLIGLDLTSVTGHYHLPDEAVLGGDLAIEVLPTAGQPRGARFARLGGGRCVLNVTGMPGRGVPTDPAALLDWTRALPVPDISDVLAGAEPIGGVVSSRYAGSLRRRYEQVDRLPERLLVMGDAAASLNPVYHQGMTVAAQQALVLRDHLRYGVPQALVFAKDVAAVLDVPWDLALGADLSQDGVTGECSEDVAVSSAFLAKLRSAATRDAVLARALWRVTGLIDPLESLMTSDIVARAMGPGGQR
jgi:2-polyprenyl-6-methoxyphenol hydroxylase-like FAD-dependent oxidoreductase